MSKLRLALRECDGADCIRIEVLDPERFEIHGFGTFMCNVKPEEVEITEEARQALLRGQARGGMQGMDFWPDDRLAWASTDPHFFVPLDCINVPSEARGWIRALGTE